MTPPVTPSSPASLRPLTRGPTATTVTVKELIAKVLAGAVRIPRFQRPLRWRRDDVLRLLDSIWRGYPVGSLLFWKRDADAGTIPVGGASVRAPATPDAWWVVDGQQRTTALAAALLDLDHAGDLRWVMAFDPIAEAFRSGPPLPDEEGRVVPVSVLGDLRRLGRWIRTSPLDDNAINLVEQAQQRLLDYAIPAYIVDTDDEQVLRGVFARLNSTGARMRADEVFQALLGTPAQPGQASLDLDALARGCDTDGFGQPPRAEIFKALLAMSDRDPTVRLDDRDIDPTKLAAPEDASEALSRTRDFLIRDCGMPAFALVPYPVVFVILARWFHVHPGGSDATRQMLARWVWRGAVSSVHQRAEVSKMREQVRDIVADDEQGSLDRLLARTPETTWTRWELQRFDSRSARSRIETLALLSCRPRDALGEVSLGEVSGRLAREIFASADWTGLSSEDTALARTAANRVLLDDMHHGLNSLLRQWDADQDAQRLASHLVDRDAFALMVAGDVGGFLRRRAEAVRGRVDALLRERTAWDRPLLRPVSTYLDRGLDGDDD